MDKSNYIQDLVWPLGPITDDSLKSLSSSTSVPLFPGFPGAYAGYAGRGGYPGYPGFGYPFAGMTLNQLQGICIPLDHINNVHAAAAALQQL